MKTEIPTPTGEFALRLSATRRGARLARLLAVEQLRTWQVSGPDDVDRVALVVAELANNAVTHGRVAGRDFEVRLVLGDDHVRVELSDARGEREPEVRVPDEGGYGLLLVAALATAWGVKARSVGKTVWATVPLGT